MGNRKFYCKGVSLYTVFLWVAILAPLCNTILLLIDKKKKADKSFILKQR